MKLFYVLHGILGYYIKSKLNYAQKGLNFRFDAKSNKILLLKKAGNVIVLLESFHGSDKNIFIVQ